MDRRKLIKSLLFTTALAPIESIASTLQITATKKKIFRNLGAQQSKVTHYKKENLDDHHIKDYLTKIRHPNRPHPEDILLSPSDFLTLESVVKKFLAIRRIIGHGHFCIIDFDKALYISRNYKQVGSFTKKELDFIEKTFYKDANLYGFKGERQIKTLTDNLPNKDVLKVPYTGNYLFKGESLHKYSELKKKIGPDLILTSGIRGITKQFYLFLNKAYRYQGNLSLASRSLAPPGYSYHATGDFDVGQKGLGSNNFSVQFTKTTVFQHLAKKGYVEHRYQRDNLLGVRYEPWHIKL